MTWCWTRSVAAPRRAWLRHGVRGCATACVAADNLQREWVGIDISPKAVELVHMRLRDALGELYHAGMVTARTDCAITAANFGTQED